MYRRKMRLNKELSNIMIYLNKKALIKAKINQMLTNYSAILKL